MKWCMNCNKPVHTETENYTMDMDGRQYNIGSVDICAECGCDELEEIKRCPVCGDEIGKSDEFCHDCYDDLNFVLL